jgi:hypothetical protein
MFVASHSQVDAGMALKEIEDRRVERARLARQNADLYAAEILAAVGDLSEWEVHLNDVLVAIFERKKIGSILIDDKSKDRDQFMAKGALILKLGPGVDVDDNAVQFHGRRLQVGQWVAFMPTDGWPIKIMGQQCRMIPDNRIRMTIPSPDLIF